MSISVSDVVFILNQIGYVVSHAATGDRVLRSAQDVISVGINPELRIPVVLETLDQVLKFSAAAQVAATFIPSPYDPEDYALEEDSNPEVPPTLSLPTPVPEKTDVPEAPPEPAAEPVPEPQTEGQ